VSLPSGYTTQEQVTDLIENVLHYGSVESVEVQQRAFNGVPYHTAFVEMGSWTDTECADSMQKQLTKAGKDKVDQWFIDFPFFWPNGKPMHYLTFKALDHMPKHSVRATLPTDAGEWPLSSADWKSIYIPCIPDDIGLFDGRNVYPLTQEHLTFMIEKGLNLGEVSRIDYVNQQKDDRTVKTAYVHFKKWHDNSQVEELRNHLNTVGSRKIYSFGSLGSGLFTFMGKALDSSGLLKDVKRYLVFKINHKPIPAAPEGANAAQLSAANVYLENLVKAKDAEIELLRAQLANMSPPIIDETVWDSGPMDMSELDTEGEEGEEVAEA
jgi:hypothetical protein